MVSKKLISVWGFLDVCLLAAGIVSLVLSLVWRAPNILMNMVLSKADLTAGTVLAIFLLITFAISIGAIVQPNHVIGGLVVLNYALVVDAIVIVVIGSFVWFFTLQERNNFYKLWLAANNETRVHLQDQFKCCGYFNGTDNVAIGGYCSSQEMAATLNETVLSNFCVTPITEFADMTLNNVFTTVYGFMAIVLCLLLATLCVIKKRQEEERFKKIDAKRGGRGFV
jgi:hypothetical protein